MNEVVGIEGAWPPTALVTWGAAAVRDSEGRIFNSITRAYASPQQGSEFDFFEFRRPVAIKPENYTDQLIAVGFRLDRKLFADHFVTETDKTPGLAGHAKQDNSQFYIFSSRATFDRYASAVANSVMLDALSTATDDPSRFRELVRSSLTIAPRSPYLNAANVYFSKNRSRAKSIAQRLVSPNEAHVYEALVKALTSDKLFYDLKWEHGIAEHGGLSISDAARVFRSLDHVQQQARNKAVVPIFPFLEPMKDELPPHRAMELEAASARIRFGVSVDGDSPLVRIARYVEIAQLQELLRGNVPAELSDDVRFLDELSTVISPDEDTVCSHRPIGAEQFEKVIYAPAPKADGPVVRSETASVLAFVQGISQNVRFAELRISSKDRVQVSVHDNGADGIPVGAAVFTGGGNFLYSPMICQLTIEHRQHTRKPVIFLRSIRPISSALDGAEVNAIPSSVQRGTLLLLSGGVPFQVKGGQLVADGLDIAVGSSFLDAQYWMLRYQSWCGTIELENAYNSDASWCYFSTLPATTTVPARIMLALKQLGGEASIAKLTEEIYKQFKKSMRKNNTRRSIRNELSDFVLFDREADIAKLSELGDRWLQVLERIHRQANTGVENGKR